MAAFPAMGRDCLQLDRLSLRFRDPREEARFAEERARATLRPLRLVIACAAAFCVLLGVMSRYGAWRSHVGTFDFLPLASFFVLGCGVALAVTFTPAFIRRQQQVVALFALAVTAGVTAVVAQFPADLLVTRGYLPLVLHLFTIYGLLGLRFFEACATGWASAAIYLGALGAVGLLGGTDLARHAAVMLLANAWGMLFAYQIDVATRRQHAAMRRLIEEQARSERLLLNILPASIAERLKADERPIADHCAHVTVLFADIVGFTPLSSRKPPHELVTLLDRIFQDFDAICERHGLEKIKTIGDAYMAVAGLPEARSDHAADAARCALGMLEAIQAIARASGEPLAVRIGIHSGPVVAGVIGHRKFSYDLWGDTVNVASRMESHGVPGRIHCTAVTATLLPEGFQLAARGPIEVEGKGRMSTYLLAPPPAG